MTLIFRVSRNGGPEPEHTFLLDEYRVMYARRHKVVRTYEGYVGTMREVADDGADKTRFNFGSLEGKWQTPRGGTRGLGGYTVKRSELKKHVRVMADEDVRKIDEIDESIARFNDLLRDCRQEREQAVADAWRRAREVNSLDLVDECEADLQRRLEAARDLGSID